MVFASNVEYNLWISVVFAKPKCRLKLIYRICVCLLLLLLLFSTSIYEFFSLRCDHQTRKWEIALEFVWQHCIEEKYQIQHVFSRVYSYIFALTDDLQYTMLLLINNGICVGSMSLLSIRLIIQQKKKLPFFVHLIFIRNLEFHLPANKNNNASLIKNALTHTPATTYHNHIYFIESSTN